MPMSDYLRDLRARVGHDLLLLPSAAVAVADAHNRLLLAKHSDRDLWVMPGGLIEPAELPADAAVRELWEETGLHVEITGVLGIFGGPDLIVNYANGDVASYVAIIFRGTIIGGEHQPDGDEILELRYFSRDELPGVPHPRWIDAAADVLYGRNGPAYFAPVTWRP